MAPQRLQAAAPPPAGARGSWQVDARRPLWGGQIAAVEGSKQVVHSVMATNICAGSVEHLWTRIFLSAVAYCFNKSLQSPPVTFPPQRFAHGRTECHFHFGTQRPLAHSFQG